MKQDYLIKKWLKDELTDGEKQAFNKLDDASLNQNIIDNAIHFKASQFNALEDFNTFKERYETNKAKVKSLNWFKPLLKIASVILISLGIYFTFFFNSNTLVKTLASQKTTVELPDHSKVELNALSSIEFNNDKWEEKRALKLEGEAYFKVEKGKIFDVITSQGVITVVGTQFNVKQRPNYFEVKCFEGIVKVVSDTIARQLLAGDSYQILNGKFSQGKIKNNVPSWTENMSLFEAIPVKEVFAELERQYNVEIKYDVKTNRLFSGGFTHDNLENAVLSITQPMNLTYEIKTSDLIVIHEKTN